MQVILSPPQEKTKKCTKCQQAKSLNAFNRNCTQRDGLASWCKICMSDYGREYRQRPEVKAHKNEYMRGYYQQPEAKLRKHEYRQRPEIKACTRVQDRKYRKSNTEKIKAQKAVYNKIRYGKMLPAPHYECTDCSKQAQHYHHESYDKEHWLDVIPLCASCHQRRHAK